MNSMDLNLTKNIYVFLSTVASVVYSYLTFSSKRNPLIFTHRLEERTKTNKVIFV